MTGSVMSAAAQMDRMYRYQRHFYDLTRKPYLLGRGRLLDDLDVPAGGTVLEIACGTGRNLIETARRYPESICFGFDISEEMLATAAASIWRSGYQKQIRLAQADAASFNGELTFGQPMFDRIVISYALSMIPLWQQVLQHALTLLKHSGSLHIVDFGPQAGLPAWFRALLYAWLARFSVSPRLDLLRVLESIARQRGARLRFQPLYRGYSNYAVLSR